MARTSTFPLYDQAVGGGLKLRLRRLRKQGMSYVDIAHELRPAVTVDPSTVRRWCIEHDIDEVAS
jgi:intein-encoded DNA endonuclease-like protein